MWWVTCPRMIAECCLPSHLPYHYRYQTWISNHPWAQYDISNKWQIQSSYSLKTLESVTKDECSNELTYMSAISFRDKVLDSWGLSGYKVPWQDAILLVFASKWPNNQSVSHCYAVDMIKILTEDLYCTRSMIRCVLRFVNICNILKKLMDQNIFRVLV